jgi:hypothetical protein
VALIPQKGSGMRCRHTGGADGRGAWTAVLTAPLVLGLALLATSRLITPARAAQAPEAPQAPTASPAIDLNRKYRFLERYSAEAAKAPGVIGQYQVAFRETIEAPVEDPRAAPRRESATRLVKYSERPAEVSGFDGHHVLSLVRRYHSVRSLPDRRLRPSDPFPLDNMTIWYQTRPGELPLIVDLTGDRPLREEDYRFAVSEQVFVPDLAGLLPDLPTRIGDSWQLSRAASQTLVGQPIGTGALTGTLAEVREGDPKAGQSMVAIEIVGRVQAARAEVAVNARVRFAFSPGPRPAAEAPASGTREDGTIDALGAIVRLDLAQITAGGSARDASRGGRKRELILERRLGDPQDFSLPLPKTPPVPTPENSWLTYVDPRLRFHFRHPQELLLEPAAESGVLLLAHRRAEGADLVRLEPALQTLLQPEAITRRKTQEWESLELQVVPGSPRWLPEAEWPGKRVYRLEAALKPGARGSRGASRVHFDGYIVQFGRNASLYAEGMTAQDPPTPFRTQVEDMLRTFMLGPPAR